MSVAVALKAALASDDPRYLFGARQDWSVFGGAMLLSALLLGIGAMTGALHGETSPWMWLALVVGIDVAHVWSTIFRVYLDPAEVRRRVVLYVGAPVLVLALGVVLYGFSALAFWRTVAYFAVWHFMRQQVGWMRLYHRRAPFITSRERYLDEALTWLVMLHPVAYWHAHLPRHFAWMLEGDFIEGVSPWIASALGILAVVVACAWLVFQAREQLSRRAAPWGRWLLIATTACAWYIGIVVFNSDYAFTVTNIPLHGIPYAMLTYRYGKARAAQMQAQPLSSLLRGGAFSFLGILVTIALVEELGWDRLVWHDHAQFFGTSAVLDDDFVAILAPLLAMPQLTHYVLDGFVWKRNGNE